MIDVRKLNVIREVFLELADIRKPLQTNMLDKDDGADGVTSCLIHDFYLVENLQKELANLIFYFEVHRSAQKENDRAAALFAIVRAGDLALKLSAFFEGIEDAIRNVMNWDPSFSWPSVPEEYRIPDHFFLIAADKLSCMAEFWIAGNRNVLMVWESAEGEIEVMENDSVDVIRKTFIELAESIGVSREAMDNEMDEAGRFEWCIDYSYSLGEQLEKDLDELLRFFEILRLALQKSDHSAAFVALLYCRIYSQNAAGFFINIKDEVDNVAILNKKFSWPSVPDDYKLPEHFGMAPHA